MHLQQLAACMLVLVARCHALPNGNGMPEAFKKEIVPRAVGGVSQELDMIFIACG
jgi:hypothetical protein